MIKSIKTAAFISALVFTGNTAFAQTSVDQALAETLKSENIQVGQTLHYSVPTNRQVSIFNNAYTLSRKQLKATLSGDHSYLIQKNYIVGLDVKNSPNPNGYLTDRAYTYGVTPKFVLNHPIVQSVKVIEVDSDTLKNVLDSDNSKQFEIVEQALTADKLLLATRKVKDGHDIVKVHFLSDKVKTLKDV